ncbi:P protein isoform X2 [Microplitis mediator]|uniref:P protein isoform X2 n=1 Tax=Microplitis mediator TaxID=375433 RepID=UPI002553E660|nr:P protein isoform X2 [Microplitis mediator]
MSLTSQISTLSNRYSGSKEKYNGIENPYASQSKPIYRYVKLGFLVIYWSIFTLLLMTKSEKPGMMNHLSIPSHEVSNVEIADEPISNKVKMNLEGPLLPTLKTDDANPSSYHLVVWLELITSDYNKSQNLTERLMIPILPPDLLEIFPHQNVQKTLHVSNYVNRSVNYLVRLNFESNLPIEIKISYAYDLSPASPEAGLIYGTVILLGLYISIIFEIINRALAAMLASTMSLAVLAFLNERPTTTELMSWIDIDTLLLLFSMMILVAILGETGLFDFLSVFAYKITNGKIWPLIYTLCFFTAVLSAFLDNTTMVLLMTPVTIRLCEVMELNPVPILTAMVIFSNIGGALTPVGDPPNVIITTNSKVIKAGMDFNYFVLHMSIGVVMALLVASVQLKYIFRDTKLLKYPEPQEIQELKHEIAIWQRAAASLSSYSREEKLVRDILLKKVKSLSTLLNNKLANGSSNLLKYKSTLEELQEKYPIRDKLLLLKSSITLIFVITLFFLHNLPNVNLSLGWTTLLGVFLILILADTKDLDGILARVEWSTLIFFAALFILMEALSCMGLIAWIGKQTEGVILSVNEDFRLAVAIILILWVSGIASAFVDNVPLTTMMVRIITNLSENDQLGLPLQPLVWALSYGACMGATANVVCAGVSEQHGYPFTYMQFFKMGFPITIGSLVTTTIYLLIAHIVFQWH